MSSDPYRFRHPEFKFSNILVFNFKISFQKKLYLGQFHGEYKGNHQLLKSTEPPSLNQVQDRVLFLVEVYALVQQSQLFSVLFLVEVYALVQQSQPFSE
jgi:hypothetical protein